jgi:hypothetical protein
MSDVRLKYKYAIGCFVQWYEVELVEEYIESVINSIMDIDSRENVIVDICFNMAQNLEKIDESEYKLEDIFSRFLDIRRKLTREGILHKISFYPNNIKDVDYFKLKPYTIADYRREFNNEYCEIADVLMWGETDSLIPKQTFEILDMLHHNNINQKVFKYFTFFSTCKMWDESWKPIEHNDFTDKPFIDNDYKNWWNHHYTMNLDELYEINDKVEDLDVRLVKPYKFNGCGLIFSSDIIKAGANIPKSVFFIHEDTSFMNQVQLMFGDSVPQYVIKNILLIHNRHHPKKRMYVKDETGDNLKQKRLSNDWYKKAGEMSEFNAYNFYKQNRLYSWEDVYDES